MTKTESDEERERDTHNTVTRTQMHKYNFLYKKETRVMQWVGGIGGGDSIEKKKGSPSSRLLARQSAYIIISYFNNCHTHKKNK